MWGLGVDIGKHADPSAIVGVELVPEILDPNLEHPSAQDRHFMKRPVKTINRYHVRHLERPELESSYSSLVERVATLMRTPKLLGETRLVADIGNAGDPLWEDWNKMGLAPIGIRITSGNNVNRSPEGYNVPKGTLTKRLMMVFAERRIEIAPVNKAKYPELAALRNALMQEMLDFRVTYTERGNATYSASSTKHDDLLMALAIIIWWMEMVYAPSRVDEGFIDTREKDADYDPLYD